jgi:hypothetical protein
MRAKFPPAAYQKIETAYERIKDQFVDADGRSLSWTLLDTYSMALQAGYELDQVSVTAYVVPNLKIHATVSDLADRKVPQGDGTFKFNNEPQEQYADSALITATHLLIVATLSMNRECRAPRAQRFENMRCLGALTLVIVSGQAWGGVPASVVHITHRTSEP